MTSCSDDDEDAPQQPQKTGLNGTEWEYNDTYTYSDGYVESLTQTIIFSQSQATIETKYILTAPDGSSVTQDNNPIIYNYTYSNNLVIFNPTGNQYHLEGVISSGIKMVVTRVEDGEVIGTFYKQ